ncbi:hypothetical protein [Flavobacterium aquidurense]|uniref:hypothetical protein n=1 Tax=Flavobacterium aquidurense TaxID=362413 RepID=UPI002865D98A|nr:hypothetical protein [Flavobacterium aquidurense]MDR7370167.1 hypothetical protein [Flavobacterium aquidurense]
MKNTSFLPILFLLLISCNSRKNLIGTYRSNFAVHGFFVTQIKFNPDSTTEYRMAGDLMNENLTGRFKVSNNIAYIKFDKLKYDQSKDNLSFSEILTKEVDTNEYRNMHSYDLKYENSIPYHLKYKIKQNKLIVYNIVTGKIVRKIQGSMNKRKYYLKKID